MTDENRSRRSKTTARSSPARKPTPKATQKIRAAEGTIEELAHRKDTMTATLIYEYDEQRDVLTVEGVQYAGELFRSFGMLPPGTVLRIDKREDGVLTVTDMQRLAT